jgi:hypothetical protein
LNLQHFLLHRILDNKPRNNNTLLLSNPMNPINSLRLNRKTPPRIQHEHPRRSHKIQSHPPSLERNQQDHPSPRARKLFEHGRALGLRGAPVEAEVGDAFTFKVPFDDVEEGGELGKDDGFGAGFEVLECAEVAEEGVEFG